MLSKVRNPVILECLVTRWVLFLKSCRTESLNPMKRSRQFSVSTLNCLETLFSRKLGFRKPAVKVSEWNVKCVRHSVLEVPCWKDYGICALPNENLLVDLNISLAFSEPYMKKKSSQYKSIKFSTQLNIERSWFRTFMAVCPYETSPGAKRLHVSVIVLTKIRLCVKTPVLLS